MVTEVTTPLGPYRIDIIRTGRWLMRMIIGMKSLRIKYNRIRMSQRIQCDLCGRTIPPHAHYVVKIEIFADPEMPPMTTEELQEMDPDAVAKLLEQMKGMTEQELQDQVHRQFEFKLCRPCQRIFLVNPLGRPRETKVGEN